MKKIFLLLSLFISTVAFSQSSMTAPYGWLGNLYVQNTWANTSDFTAVGSPTFTASGGVLTLSGGNQHPSSTVGTTNTAFNQVEKITAYGGTMLERWKYSITFVVNNTPGSTTYGIGIGTYGTSASAGSSAVAYFDASTATGHGQVYLLLGASQTTAAISNTSMSFSSGDTIVMNVERNVDRIYATARDLATNVMVEVGYVWDESLSTNIFTPNTGNFAIVNFGGSQKITSISVTSDEVIGASLLLAGDSKFAGYNTTWDLRIANILNRYYPGTIVSSGEGDRTADLINHLPEILTLNPKYVILNIGRNDLANGVATGTWEANLDTIAVRLNRANIPFAICNALYETAQSQTAIINFLDTAVLFSGKVIRTYDPGNFTGSIGYGGDLVHPSWLQTQVDADVIRNYLTLNNYGKFLNDKFPIRTQNLGVNAIYNLGGDLNMNGFNSNNLWYNPSQGRTGHDIVVSAGSIITGAYGTGAQANSIVLAGVGTATLDFRAYTSTATPTNPIMRWYTAASGVTGNQTLAMALSEGGYLLMGNTPSTGLATATAGDIFQRNGVGLKSAISLDGKHEAALILQSSIGSSDFHNYDSTGTSGVYRWYWNAANAALNQKVGMAFTGQGNLLVNDSTDRTTAQLQVTSPSQAQLALHYDPTHYSTFTTNSSGDLTITPTSGITTVSVLHSGNLTIGGAGSGLFITEGSNGHVGQTSLTSGTKAVTITGITASSRAFITLVSQSGTTTTTVAYEGVCTSNTLTINAVTSAGTNTVNTGDASTVNYLIIN